jgi:flagella basal body P-ring formation protein FlgA
MKYIAALLVNLTFVSTVAFANSVSPLPLKQVIADTIAARVPAPGRYEVDFAIPDEALEHSLQNGRNRKLERLTYNPGTQSFNATFIYRNDLGNDERVTLSGSAYAVIGVPTLTQDIVAGEPVSTAGLSTIDVPAARVSTAMITAPEAIIGQVARRPIRANTPLFASDFTKPVLVRKGDTITILAEMPGIRISAQGKAMTNGARGDVVSFMNTSSRRTVEARIVDAGTAVITSSARTVAAN